PHVNRLEEGLPVGRTYDPAERDANAVADAVMGGADAGAQLGRVARRPAPSRTVRRQGAVEKIEPHYPSVEERARIQELLERAEAGAPAGAAAPRPGPAPAPAGPAAPGAAPA